jgi:DNA-binding GntR family transcriptional regulator
MIDTLHLRIWRWRALGLSHPQRSAGRSKESIEGLRAMLAAIKKRHPSLAERIIRDEVTRAAAEATRLLVTGSLSTPMRRTGGS